MLTELSALLQFRVALLTSRSLSHCLILSVPPLDKPSEASEMVLALLIRQKFASDERKQPTRPFVCILDA